MVCDIIENNVILRSIWIPISGKIRAWMIYNVDFSTMASMNWATAKQFHSFFFRLGVNYFKLGSKAIFMILSNSVTSLKFEV